MLSEKAMLSQQQEKIISKILPTLNESQARWFVAKEALSLGRGGIQYIHELTGFSRPTISKGIKEIEGRKKLNRSNIRSEGGGRNAIEQKHPGIDDAIKKIMDETTAGDPMSALRWTCKSTYKIAEELGKQGWEISQRSVHRKLVEMDYSLQLNVKHKEGTGAAHKDRDKQFKNINKIVKRYLSAQDPVISVDAKKKELIGEFKNDGTAWRKKRNPNKVNVYDFPSLSEGKATPYGAYDIQNNEGFVNVGMTHDTSEFAVNSILQWWQHMGKKHYNEATRLLICADGGGSNGSRVKAWKYYLQELSNKLSLIIDVCHYPPGTSKWNKIEHRLFSFISLHWKGEPLVSYETVVNLIGTTTTKNGLKVKARLDKKNYKKGKKFSDSDMKDLNIAYDEKLPKWNYTIEPRQ